MIIAYILYWIPDQAEDFYKVLVNDYIILDLAVAIDLYQEKRRYYDLV